MRSLHTDIMNIECPHNPPFPFSSGQLATEQLRAYKEGHRDARHAAAELATQADMHIEELEKKCSAYANLVKAKEGQIAHFQTELLATREANSTLASERKANALLTSGVEMLEAALKVVCDAAQPVSNVAYNLAQSHKSWDTISKDISALDCARREGYSILRELSLSKEQQ